MIRLHAMAAPYDLPGIHIRQGDTMYHLLSDVAGPAGTAELLNFVRACDGRDAWIQAVGTYREHFDFFGELAEQAMHLGARLATGAEVAAILTRKREQFTDDRIPVPAITSYQMRASEQIQRSPMHGSLVGVVRQKNSAIASYLLTLAQKLVGKSLVGTSIVVCVHTSYDPSQAAFVQDMLMQGAHVTIVQTGKIIRQTYLQDHTILSPFRDLDFHLGMADLIIEWLWTFSENAVFPKLMTLNDADIQVIEHINASGKPIISIEIPTGLDASDYGAGGLPCVRATATLALGLPLRGLTPVAAGAYSGDVWLGDIGITPRALKSVGVRVGDIFAAGALQRLARVPLAEGLLDSDVTRFVLARD